MFPAGDGKWEPVKVRKIVKAKPAAPKEVGDGDVNLEGTDDKPQEKPKEEDEESEYEEDPESEEGAVYPLKGTLHHSLLCPNHNS